MSQFNSGISFKASFFKFCVYMGYHPNPMKLMGFLQIWPKNIWKNQRCVQTASLNQAIRYLAPIVGAAQHARHPDMQLCRADMSPMGLKATSEGEGEHWTQYEFTIPLCPCQIEADWRNQVVEGKWHVAIKIQLTHMSGT